MLTLLVHLITKRISDYARDFLVETPYIIIRDMIDLHLILVFVSWILVRALWHFHYKKNPIPQRIVHGTTIEIIWTISPSIILMLIAIPSFALLYSMDEVVVDPAITIKAIERQWYGTSESSGYNSSDEQSLTFDSYTIPEDDLELGQSRLLEVDNRVVVPAKTHIRIIVTSADVPSIDAGPSIPFLIIRDFLSILFSFPIAECADQDPGPNLAHLVAERWHRTFLSADQLQYKETIRTLPRSAPAPDIVIDKVIWELKLLCQKGKKRTMSQREFLSFVRPLNLDRLTIKDALAIIERISDIHEELGRSPLMAKDRYRLYSVVSSPPATDTILRVGRE